jgi:hypothetical protein
VFVIVVLFCAYTVTEVQTAERSIPKVSNNISFLNILYTNFTSGGIKVIN